MLDVGCGSGWLAEHFETTRASTRCRKRPPPPRPRVGTCSADVDEPLPFDDASFDGVILKDVLEHVRDPVAVVQEARRVLRPGGRVFASSPDAQRWVWDDYTHRRPFTRKSFGSFSPIMASRWSASATSRCFRERGSSPAIPGPSAALQSSGRLPGCRSCGGMSGCLPGDLTTRQG